MKATQTKKLPCFKDFWQFLGGGGVHFVAYAIDINCANS